MGLCKCPKKKVTNLFCYEHRVNVCEHCLVANHSRCIVQSYLQWLQDSDYDPTCHLCGKKLATDEQGECVRLLCYDVFHWSCLDHYARNLPAQTAPAGYTCPICESNIFPANNIASPVAESLREVLSKVNWARAGLCLPLMEEPRLPSSELKPHQSENMILSSNGNNSLISDVYVGECSSVQSQSTCPLTVTQTTRQKHTLQTSLPDSIITVDTGAAPYVRAEKDFASAHTTDCRKLFDTTKEDFLNQSHDHDEDKYKRRPALQWFGRWFRSRSAGKKSDPNATFKRLTVVMILGLLCFLTVIVIFSRLGRAATEKDPFLDPMANPHIQVNDLNME